MKLPRPLEQVPSIKIKLSILIVVAVAMTALTSQIGLWLGWPVWIRPFIAGSAALLMVQFLARGMTRPLRDMADATTDMAHGDYGRRVEIESSDEVGQLAIAFNAMATELGETDRQRKEFVANASHELRTPVAALRSMLENLVDGVGQPDAATLAKMLSRAEHLSMLVGQLLDLSRLDSQTDLGEMQEIDLGDLLHKVADEVMTAHPRSEVIVRSPVGLRIQGGPQRLHQVFVNIVGNAARFSHPRQAVSVTASQSNGSVVVAIRDTGPGISPEDQSKVFERFYQAGGTARTGTGGAGLGLSISKQIVDQHNGSVELSENKPSGACFVVRLPRTQPTAQPPARGAPGAP